MIKQITTNIQINILLFWNVSKSITQSPPPPKKREMCGSEERTFPNFLRAMILTCHKSSSQQTFHGWFTHTVDGRNPAPPGMSKTLQIIGINYISTGVGFFHQLYHWKSIRQLRIKSYISAIYFTYTFLKSLSVRKEVSAISTHQSPRISKKPPKQKHETFPPNNELFWPSCHNNRSGKWDPPILACFHSGYVSAFLS